MSWGAYLVSHLWELLLLALLLACSGFFSGTETALFNLTRGQLYRFSKSKSRLGPMVASLMRRPRRLLQTLLLGNMLVNVAYEAVAAVMIIALGRRGLHAGAAVALAAVPVFVLILVGEVIPKMLAYRFAERWAVAAVGPLSFLCRLLRPVVWALETSLVMPISRLIAPHRPAQADITASELFALLDLSAKRGLIGQDAGALMQEIVHLTGIRVCDIMVPRVDVISYDVHDPSQGLIDLFARTRLRKVPVYDGKIDNVLGVIHAKRLLLNRSRPLRELVSPVVFIPEAANIERALLQFRVRRAQTAMVVDEYGGIAGLVTLEDIAEQIVGDIEETQQTPRGKPVRRIARGVYMLDGDLAIHEWAQAFGIDLAERRVSTVGGFMTSLLGRIPVVGDQAAYRNLNFTVEQMRGRRVSLVRLELEAEKS